ncbi:MAG: tRNA threonylcarbamoyl adenosine modification protein YeaZ [Hyphomicrobiales bacterium]|nr:tRNA threonylcarbamoyl adenosine modification protein YeaZ [Hyphomicrobiales bacterium]
MILAIDTALGAVSACVTDSDGLRVLSTERMLLERGHAEALAPLLDRVLARSGCSFDQISKVAVSVGPGSFTGVRVGVAAARALGLAWERPVVGVSTLAAFAAPLVGQAGGVIAAAVDARHGRVFCQLFHADGRQLTSPQLLGLREVTRLIGSGPAQLAGNAASLLAIECWSMGIAVEIAGDAISPDIKAIARLGALSDARNAPPKPLYLKEPDVTIAPAAVR